MATISDYRDSFHPGNVFTIPRAFVTSGHEDNCSDLVGARDTCACQWESSESTVVLSVQGMGGTKPGEAYAESRWFYELRSDGDVLWEGNDLASGGFPMTAEQMGAVLISTLISYVEHCYYPGGGTDAEIQEIASEHGISERLARFGVVEYDRLGDWVYQVEGSEE